MAVAADTAHSTQSHDGDGRGAFGRDGERQLEGRRLQRDTRRQQSLQDVVVDDHRPRGGPDRSGHGKRLGGRSSGNTDAATATVYPRDAAEENPAGGFSGAVDAALHDLEQSYASERTRLKQEIKNIRQRHPDPGSAEAQLAMHDLRRRMGQLKDDHAQARASVHAWKVEL
eukprot:CAMPEP_0206052374 /NCGR_PEP_ID=MMETSP1466-20131121/33622_1 /ASSEMBLY_ACC=CAM_ASM_001126 /TAXON_ID=44452 /ORGANISM="Pavlova gyrans, Strain CCMP608" /LENGTH=170 /DNA_ID=CAMNT_0053427527 /DNA_START=1 /DNA_END=513 /DNA_ORIENTATION=-